MDMDEKIGFCWCESIYIAKQRSSVPSTLLVPLEALLFLLIHLVCLLRKGLLAICASFMHTVDSPSMPASDLPNTGNWPYKDLKKSKYVKRTIIFIFAFSFLSMWYYTTSSILLDKQLLLFHQLHILNVWQNYSPYDIFFFALDLEHPQSWLILSLP